MKNENVTMSIEEEIAAKEKELAALREQARVEKEKMRKQNEAKMMEDLNAVLDALKKYNEKYGDHLTLSRTTNELSDFFKSLSRTFYGI